MKERIATWLDERIGWTAVTEIARHKTVPVHRHSLWYYLGGATVFLFGIQVGTGILLMLYYRPSAGEAYESVQFIMTQVSFGWLVRSIHSWSANLMVGAAFVHLFSVFFLRAYRRPREFTWFSGVILLFLTLGFGFSGYLLPWNELAYFATRVGTDFAGAVPLVGGWMRTFLRGGEAVTGGTLSRFYGWHVAILPALTTVFLALHLYLVQRHGMSVPIGEEKRAGRTMPFFPNFLLRDLFGWVVALAALAALAAYAPWELGTKADPFAPAPADIKPEWYFMFMFETLKVVPRSLAIPGFGLAGLVVLLVPFLDRGAAEGKRNRLFTAAGWLALIYMTVLTGVGYHSIWPVVVPAVGIVLVWLVGSRGLMVLAAALASILFMTGTAAAAAGREDACIACHRGLADVSAAMAAPVESWERDVHRDKGLGCVSCHGGDPSMEVAQNAAASMDPAKGYVGIPERRALAEFCGRCHSDATYMRQFNASPRVDQVQEYRTSIHGLRNAEGDEKVATCTDCHGLHGMLRVSNPGSPAYPANVPETCGGCHGNADLMSSYDLPATQLANWRRSVHAEALLERGDLSAPACNDCHGNHGAVPPGVTSLAFVCGSCHGREALLFRESFKKELFDSIGASECATCHGNHEVLHPTDELIGTGEGTTCSQCHEAGDACDRASAEIRGAINRYLAVIDEAREVLGRAERAGMEVSEPLFTLKKEGVSGLVETRALIHTFDAERLVARAEEGINVTSDALAAGHAALDELSYRRTGLVVSFVFILVLLAGLYLKIRQVDRREAG